MHLKSLSLRAVFLSSDGLRGGWRVMLFAAAAWYLPDALSRAASLFLGYVPGNGFSPVDIAAYGLSGAVSSLLVAFVLVRIERRGFSWFGLPWRLQALPPFFWGLLASGGMVTALFGVIVLSSHASVDGLALRGGELRNYLWLWVGAMTLVGFAEELFYRGYALRALAGSVGFWPAAVVTSVLFGAVHFFLKPMETIADILNIIALALFICFTIRRSGTIWFGIGFHAAFDFFALSLYGAPNTGNNGLPLPDHILKTHIGGPAWLTGGPQGLEASWLLIPLIIGAAWLFGKYQPVTRYELWTEHPPVSNTP